MEENKEPTNSEKPIILEGNQEEDSSQGISIDGIPNEEQTDVLKNLGRREFPKYHPRRKLSAKERKKRKAKMRMQKRSKIASRKKK